MYFVIRTYRTGTYQVVKTEYRHFAAKYGAILFSSAVAVFAQRVCKFYQQKTGEMLYD